MPSMCWQSCLWQSGNCPSHRIIGWWLLWLHGQCRFQILLNSTHSFPSLTPSFSLSSMPCNQFWVSKMVKLESLYGERTSWTMMNSQSAILEPKVSKLNSSTRPDSCVSHQDQMLLMLQFPSPSPSINNKLPDKTWLIGSITDLLSQR